MSDSTSKACLIIFARYPQAGQVKTRLMPAVGGEGAAAIYREMAEFTLDQARGVAAKRAISVQVWFTGGRKDALQQWLGEDLTYAPQPEGNLGDRLLSAFRAAFEQGYGAAMAIGTDCPSLDTAILIQALEALQHHQLVLGPSTDGGYYLMGLRRSVPELFAGIAWSTDKVLQQTEAIAATLGLTQYRLPSLTDVDNPEDLEIWYQIKGNTNR
jgi:hypothetical protein